MICVLDCEKVLFHIFQMQLTFFLRDQMQLTLISKLYMDTETGLSPLGLFRHHADPRGLALWQTLGEIEGNINYNPFHSPGIKTGMRL